MATLYEGPFLDRMMGYPPRPSQYDLFIGWEIDDQYDVTGFPYKLHKWLSVGKNRMRPNQLVAFLPSPFPVCTLFFFLESNKKRKELIWKITAEPIFNGLWPILKTRKVYRQSSVLVNNYWIISQFVPNKQCKSWKHHANFKTRKLINIAQIFTNCQHWLLNTSLLKRKVHLSGLLLYA